MMQFVTVLGSTGSIGKSTLDVISQHADQYSIYALVANSNVDIMLQQIMQFNPVYAVMADTAAAQALRAQVEAKNCRTEILDGQQAIIDIAADSQAQIVMAAIVGAAGLLPTLKAIQAGKKVLLANKEALVMSGAYFMQQATLSKATLLPVDSEHNAIFQCLPNQVSEPYQGVSRIVLTASGGPFRQASLSDLEQVTPEQACAHPNWQMGKKISVDSATMMNKGLELIEAHWLFAMPHDKIDVLIHPQSIIHSMVSYADGSVLAQLGNPDMRTPIAHALAWPNRVATTVKPLDLAEIAELHFEKPDLQRFPCLQLAYDAVMAGKSASIVLNAANEIAVDAFLHGKIRFLDIAGIVAESLEQSGLLSVSNLEEILQVDQQARQFAEKQIEKICL